MEYRQLSDQQLFLNQRFESVQSLRGIAALFVVMQHICFLQRGSFGVDLFFLISGFIMMYVTEKSTEHFLLKRAIRLLPLYYGMTLVSYLALLFLPGMFEQTTASPVYLLKSLCFIPFSMGGVTQPLLRVGWTVNYEVLFYLLFFCATKVSHKYRALICSGVLVCLTVIGGFVPEEAEPFAFWTDSIILEFVAGMGLFYVFRFLFRYYRKETEKYEQRAVSQKGAEKYERRDVSQKGAEEYKQRAVFRKGTAWLMVLLCILLFGYEWWSYESPALGALPEVIRWGIPSVLILCMTFWIGCILHMPKWLVRLGDMSFSLYLVHYYPMRVLNKILGNTEHAGGKELLITCAVAAVTLLGAAVCYQLVEVRLTGYLKKKLLR